MTAGHVPHDHTWIDEASAVPPHVGVDLAAAELSWYVSRTHSHERGESMSMDTAECAPNTFKVGDNVTIMDESCGWANVHKGQIGVITSTTDDRIWLDIPGITSGWECRAKDLKLAQATSRSPHRCGLVNYVEQFKERLYNAKDEADRAVRSHQAQSKKWEKALKGVKEPNSKAFDQLKEQIESIRMDYPTFSFITKLIVIPYYMPDQQKTIKVHMGKYKVTCDMRGSGSTTVSPVDGSNRTRDGYCHPHVNSGQRPCWGTYGSPIRATYKNLDVIGYIGIMLDFLNSCDAQGWYTSVIRWADPNDVGNDTCVHCGYGIDNCECEREDECEHCGNHEDECQCTRCPDSYDRLDNDEFPDTMCGGCSYLCKNIPESEWQCHFHGGDRPHFSAPLDSFSTGLTRHETIH